MSKYRIVLEVDIEHEEHETPVDPELWMAAVLDTAFTKPNPVPPPAPRDRLFSGWTPRVPLPPREHPYKPRIVGVTKVEGT